MSFGKKLIRVLTLLLITVVNGNLLTLTFLPISNGNSLPIFNQIIGLILLSITVIVMIYLAKKWEFPVIAHWPWSAKEFLIVLLGVASMYIIAQISAQILLLYKITSSENGNLLLALFSHFNFIIKFAFGSLLIPCIEETIFRVGIIGYLFKGKPLLGLLISSLVFGLMHEPRLSLVLLFYSSMRMILGLVYLKAKRLDISIAVHGLHNFIFMLL